MTHHPKTPSQPLPNPFREVLPATPSRTPSPPSQGGGSEGRGSLSVQNTTQSGRGSTVTIAADRLAALEAIADRLRRLFGGDVARAHLEPALRPFEPVLFALRALDAAAGFPPKVCESVESCSGRRCQKPKGHAGPHTHDTFLGGLVWP